MFTMLYGGKDKTWMDSNGKRQTENFACNKWTQWAKDNTKIHILSNESIKKVLMAFRSTIRIVQSSSESDSRLETIIRRQAKKHADLTITTAHLEDADFYTYVRFLEKASPLYWTTCPNTQKYLRKSRFLLIAHATMTTSCA